MNFTKSLCSNIGLATKSLLILSIHGLADLFVMSMCSKHLIYIVFLLFGLPTLISKKIVSISYLVSFLFQFKYRRTNRAFQTYFIVLFLKSQECITSIQKFICRIWE